MLELTQDRQLLDALAEQGLPVTSVATEDNGRMRLTFSETATDAEIAQAQQIAFAFDFSSAAQQQREAAKGKAGGKAIMNSHEPAIVATRNAFRLIHQALTALQVAAGQPTLTWEEAMATVAALIDAETITK